MTITLDTLDENITHFETSTGCKPRYIFVGIDCLQQIHRMLTDHYSLDKADAPDGLHWYYKGLEIIECKKHNFLVIG